MAGRQRHIVSKEARALFARRQNQQMSGRECCLTLSLSDGNSGASRPSRTPLSITWEVSVEDGLSFSSPFPGETVMPTARMIMKQHSSTARHPENFRIRMPTQQTQRERESQAVDDRCWTNNDSPSPQACSQLDVTHVDQRPLLLCHGRTFVKRER